MNKNDILSLIINNNKFEMIQAKLNKFNPFKVLKVQDHEIRHSNILSWIFDPKANHNFDDRILKHFLLSVLVSPSNDEKLEDINLPYEIKKANLFDIVIFREKDNIDILIVSESNKLVILIENKVYSREHSNQLTRYLNLVQKKYEGFKIIPILLTIDGNDATHNDYFSASYSMILESIEFVLDNYRDRTSKEVIDFISYYCTILKEKYDMDEELKRLCKEMYQDNKEVIDLIYAIGNEIDIETPSLEFKNSHPEIEVVSIKSRAFFFARSEFSKGRSVDRESWGAGFPVCIWFSEYYGKLKIVLEIGPLENSDKRRDFLSHLENNGVTTTERAKEVGRKYTRIYTKTHQIKDWTDNQEILDVMNFLYDAPELNQLLVKLVSAINNFTW